MTILVASTVAGHCCDGKLEFSWLKHADAWRARGYEFFLAPQIGQGHDAKIQPVIDKVRALGGRVWPFSLDVEEESVNGGSRLHGIVTGRNLAHQYAQQVREISHIMFLDTDVVPTEDGVEQLLAIDHAMVAATVQEYCHSGPGVAATQWESATGLWTHLCEAWPAPITSPNRLVPEGADVREHWTTAGALLVRRDLFRALRWRTDNWVTDDPNDAWTDDPCFQRDAEAMGYGMTWVRHDVVWKHPPLVRLDRRGRDLSVVR